MPELEIDDQGLLIPPRYLSGLSPKVNVRPIKGGLLIESAGRAEAREQLRAMVDAIRTGSDAPDATEITEMVEQVRTERARHR
jgi:hypothetical protein